MSADNGQSRVKQRQQLRQNNPAHTDVAEGQRPAAASC